MKITTATTPLAKRAAQELLQVAGRALKHLDGRLHKRWREGTPQFGLILIVTQRYQEVDGKSAVGAAYVTNFSAHQASAVRTAVQWLLDEAIPPEEKA